MKFYRCRICGNIIEFVEDSGVAVVCCGEDMQEIVAGKIEASREKHIPVYEVIGNEVVVKIGSIDHPMIPEHYIQWVALQTKQGIQRKELWPNTKPEVHFDLTNGDEVVSVYAYCNLHGLWETSKK